MVTTATETRTCRTCCRELPITDFRWNHTGKSRHKQCRQCFVEYHRQWRTARRKKDVHGFAQKVIKESSRGSPLAPLVTKMIRRFGGLDRFVDVWMECIHAARAAGKWHLITRHYRALIAVMQAAEKLKQSVTAMKDEDLSETIRAETTQLISERPELILWAATQLDGWTVIPPTEQAKP